MAFGRKNKVNVNPFNYNICLLGESKIGKAQPISEPVLTNEGWKPMGSIRLGDKVYGEDGTEYMVQKIFPQGVQKIYKIIFRDGTYTRSTLNHLWEVKTRSQKYSENLGKFTRRTVLELGDILKDYKTIENDKVRYKYIIPTVEAIDFKDNVKLHLDAYKLGVRLGKRRRIVCEETDMVKQSKEKELLNYYNLYNLIGKELFIPKDYLFASITDRRMLLSGILNTAGTFKGTKISVSTASQKFANDIAELSRGLGFIAVVLNIEQTVSNYYIVNLFGDFDTLELSEGKKKRLKKPKTSYQKTIIDIIEDGEEEAKCIKVSNPTGLYITKDYIVTHNTTIVKEMCSEHLGDDGYLFVEMGSERGADAIEGINYINCSDWNTKWATKETIKKKFNQGLIDKMPSDKDFDEDGYYIKDVNYINNNIGFSTLIDDLVENKSTKYPNLKVLVIDTYDWYINLASKKVVDDWNKEQLKNDKPKLAKSLNGTHGGFKEGDKVVLDLMDSIESRLNDVGIRLFIIGHVKNKTLTDPITNESYQQISSDQQQNFFNHLKKGLHFLALAYKDRTIKKEEVKQKIGNNKVVGIVENESRKISFREDNYAVDSGSRFSQIVNEINFNSKDFYKAMEDAITKEIESNGGDVAKRKKTNKSEENIIESEISIKEKLDKIVKDTNDIVEKIITYCVENKHDLEKIRPIMTLCKDLGYNSPKDINKKEDAEKVLKLISGEKENIEE